MEDVYFPITVFENGYEWRSDVAPYDGRQFLTPPTKKDLVLDKSPFLCPVYGMTTKYPVQILSPTLYRKVANLWPSMDNIIKFTQKYGLLKSETLIPLRNERQKEYTLDFIEGCSLADFQEEIWDLHDAVYMLDLIRNGYAGNKEKMVNITEKYIRVLVPAEDIYPEWARPIVTGFKFEKSQSPDIDLKVHRGTMNINGHYYYVLSDTIYADTDSVMYNLLKDMPLIDIFKYFLVRMINKKYDGNIIVKSLVDAKAKVFITRRYLIPKHLVTFLYTQIERDLIGKTKYKQCKYCGEYFVQTDERQEYCPEVLKIPHFNFEDDRLEIIKNPTGKHCRKDHYNKDKELAQKMYKEGKSISEIAAVINRPIDTIQGWFKFQKQR